MKTQEQSKPIAHTPGLHKIRKVQLFEAFCELFEYADHPTMTNNQNHPLVKASNLISVAKAEGRE